jgi:hypothetical protein
MKHWINQSEILTLNIQRLQIKTVYMIRILEHLGGQVTGLEKVELSAM